MARENRMHCDRLVRIEPSDADGGRHGGTGPQMETR